MKTLALLIFLAATPVASLAAADEPVAAPPSPAAAPAEDPFAEDFDDFGGERPSLALGPLPSGKFLLSADVGWLRSAIRGQVGIGKNLDFVFYADAFLLEGLFDHQNGIHAGMRWTPLTERNFRLSVEASFGATFIAGRVSAANVFDLRGEVTAGWVQPELATIYARVQIRALTDAAAGESHWGRDSELGLGVERAFGPFVFGAEGFVWTRPDLDRIDQWRIRAGYQF